MPKLFKSRRPRRRPRRVLPSKALKKIIQKEIHKDVERKFTDSLTQTIAGAQPYLMDATAEFIPINANNDFGVCSNTIQGTTDNTRVGNEIRVKNLSLKFRAKAFSATATGVVYIVRFPQCNGLNPTIANVFQTVTDIASAHRNPTYMNDYHILGKIMIQANAGTTLNRVYSWSKSYKGAGLKVEYNDGTSGTDPEVEFNNVFLLAQSNGSDDVISINDGVFRVTYTDS